MNSLSKTRVPIAVSGKSKHDLPVVHQTTADFFQLLPAYYYHMVRGETVKVPTVAYTRLKPLSVPTFGSIMQKMHVFFVPYRCIMRNWEAFKADSINVATINGSAGVVSNPPYFYPSSLVSAFTGDTDLCVSGTSSNWDFQDSNNFYKLTTDGMRALTMIESLGYKLFNEDSKVITPHKINALALLALARCYYDWFAASPYMDSNYILFLQGLFEQTSNSGYQFSASELRQLIKGMLYVNFNDDYFTLAWDNPLSPNNQISSVYRMSDITNGNSSYADVITNGSLESVNPNGTPLIGNGQNSPNANFVSMLSKYSLEALESLSSYLKRFQIVGSRVGDRVLAEFGVQLEPAVLNRSMHLKSFESVIKIGDVMSHAGTNVNPLGDYAGQGQGKVEDMFEFQTNEYGILIVTSSLIPDYGYFQGLDRHNIHMDKLDWWTPEFDSLGVQAIAKCELYVSDNLDFGLNGEYFETFGYTPRYAEYKDSSRKQFVTGEYRLPSWDAGGSSWHLNRIFQDANFVNNPANMVHSLWFMVGNSFNPISYTAQFDRIFDYTDDDRDHFNQYFFFGTTSYSPVLSLFDSFDFHEDNDNKKVTLPSNGTKLN